MNRRFFVQTMTAAMAALSGTPSAMTPPGGLSTLANPALTAFLGGHDCILRIGLAYRHRFPEESDPEMLARAVRSSMNGDAILEDTIARDFTLGDTVLLDGWLLARTEARQAALYSLTNS